jgi:hypothetical protein
MLRGGFKYGRRAGGAPGRSLECKGTFFVEKLRISPARERAPVNRRRVGRGLFARGHAGSASARVEITKGNSGRDASGGKFSTASANVA